VSDSADHDVNLSQCENQKCFQEILPHFTMVEGAEPFRYCYMWWEGGGG